MSRRFNSNAGKELESLTSRAGFTQLTDKPSNFLSGGSSCIDLIFCNKPEMVSVSEIDHSLFRTCHHNLIFVRITDHVSLPSNYSREVSDYKNVIAEGIQLILINAMYI